MASWGCCVSVYDSSEEPAGRPGCSWKSFTEPSGSQFEFGEASSEDDVRKSISRDGGLLTDFES